MSGARFLHLTKFPPVSSKFFQPSSISFKEKEIEMIESSSYMIFDKPTIAI